MVETCQLTDLRTGKLCWSPVFEGREAHWSVWPPRGFFFDEWKLVGSAHNSQGFFIWDMRTSNEPFCEVTNLENTGLMRALVRGERDEFNIKISCAGEHGNERG